MNKKILIGTTEDTKVFLEDQDFGRLNPIFVTNKIQNNFVNSLTVGLIKNNYSALVINSDELSDDLKNNYFTLNSDTLRDVIDILDIDINTLEDINLKTSVIKEATKIIVTVLDSELQLLSINVSLRMKKILSNIIPLIVASNENFLTLISALKNNYIVVKLVENLDARVKNSLKDNIDFLHEYKNIKSYTDTIKSLIAKLEDLENFMPTKTNFKNFSLMDELKNKKLIIVDNSAIDAIQKSIINLVLCMRLKLATEIKFNCLNSKDEEKIIFRIDNSHNIDEKIKNQLLDCFQYGGACPYHVKFIVSSENQYNDIKFSDCDKIEIKNNNDATLRTVKNFGLINLDFKIIK